MELSIDHLTIEVTRKCNMRCEHCLRGPAQRKTIDNHHIYKIMQLINNVSTLTITGGEPTLAMDSLEQIKHCAMYGSCDVNSFYMVTNGKAINVEALAQWAYGMKFACTDNEISRIGFSFDCFHTNTFNCKQVEKRRRNYYKLKDVLLCEYGIDEADCGGSFITRHSNQDWGYHSLITQGRAKDFGARDNRVKFFEEDTYTYENEEYIRFIDTSLYLSSNGYLIAGCDWSYHNIDHNEQIRIAHIDDITCRDDLINAILLYNKKQEVDLLVA